VDSIHGLARYYDRRRRIAARSLKRITLARLSFGLAILRVLAVAELAVALFFVPTSARSLQMVVFACLAFYGMAVLLLSKPIHDHLLGSWLPLVTLDGLWLLSVVFLTGGASSPVFWLLAIPPAGAALYAKHSVRTSTLALAAPLLVVFLFGSLASMPVHSPAVVFQLANEVLVLLLASGLVAVLALTTRGHEAIHALRRSIASPVGSNDQLDEPRIESHEDTASTIEALEKEYEALQTDQSVLCALVRHPVLLEVRTALGLSKDEWPDDSPRPLMPLDSERTEAAIAKLAPRHKNVIVLRALGLEYKEIAHRTGLSQKTVKTYLDEIKEAINLRSQLQLALFAVLTGLIDESADPAEEAPASLTS
jgi:DNA-directed RNA polymerase specialized sigma24 family protein